MNDSQPTDEQFAQNFQTLITALPAPIRAFLQSEKRNELIRELAITHKLRVDQADVFEQALTFMLLGVYSPEEFVQKLKDARVDDTTTSAIVQDVNEKIFSRLRAEEEKGEGTAEPTPQPQVTQPSVPMPQYAPPSTPQSPPAKVIAPVQTTPPEKPIVQNISEKMVAPVQTPPPPQQSPEHLQPVPQQTVPPPQQKMPPVMPAPIQQPVAPTPQQNSAPSIKTYPSDPYREPIE